MSDRPLTPPTLEERADDIRAVMDAAGSERAYIFGTSEGGSMACVFAATYPERTNGLCYGGPRPPGSAPRTTRRGVTMEEALAEIEELTEHGVTDAYLFGDGAGADATLPEEEKDRIRRWWRSAATPGAIAALERMNLDLDIRGILSSIHVPTLVMNRTHDDVADIDAARDLAARIDGARFVEFPGAAHAFIRGTDTDDVIEEIQEFVTGFRPTVRDDRSLATVLFTDIVGSTQRAVELGDHAWRDRRAAPRDHP